MNLNTIETFQDLMLFDKHRITKRNQKQISVQTQGQLWFEPSICNQGNSTNTSPMSLNRDSNNSELSM